MEACKRTRGCLGTGITSSGFCECPRGARAKELQDRFPTGCDVVLQGDSRKGMCLGVGILDGFEVIWIQGRPGYFPLKDAQRVEGT